ncbi:MAG: hypothetical protein R3271_01930 [Methylophaga sp.]|nr:hypothetical protein [Methylophaga sp.]MDX1749062.1 hypothetical protein [Methylophaga sp.]
MNDRTELSHWPWLFKLKPDTNRYQSVKQVPKVNLMAALMQE